ncbi:MAG: hypothetical protein ACRDVW_01715, partial [Acidimicrobiales bacterium]
SSTSHRCLSFTSVGPQHLAHPSDPGIDVGEERVERRSLRLDGLAKTLQPTSARPDRVGSTSRAQALPGFRQR